MASRPLWEAEIFSIVKQLNEASRLVVGSRRVKTEEIVVVISFQRKWQQKPAPQLVALADRT